ncbi:uncharacterized protein LOC127278043 [Leptopilina boulardi]|uniref:uncharacterized protein LOC127278043 n=1 Tax=Leptopilina boulardi TaxID=63433 RepID=UPI0021F65996|nr:uncharacterized protein LOC127278043 [Leptopilina boulardi]
MKILFFQNWFSNLGGRFIKGEVNEQSPSEGSRTQQYFTAACACTIIAASGSYQVWSSPSIPHLTSKKFKFSVTEQQIIWIVSLYNVGDIFGAFLNPLFIDRIGRKNTLFLFSLPSLIGWGLIIFAQNYIYLCIARFIGGISQASAFNSLSIYLTEISDKNVRGMLVNMMQISLYIGVFTFTTIGAFASYETLNISSASILIIFILIISFLPETPYYYLLQGRRADAMKCLMKLRGISSSDKLEPEISEMELVIEEDKKNTKTFAFLELFTKSYNRKGLIIMFFMRATMMLSGIVAIIAYAEDIFSQSSLPIKTGIQVIIFNGIGLPASLCTGFFIDKINRRLLFSTTAMLGSFCLGSVGLFFFLKYYLRTETSSIAWLPVVALTLLQIFFISGFGIIPHISIGEFFSMKVKGSAVCLGRILISVINFATTAGYKPLSNSFGIYTTFWIFASLTFVGSLVTYWITPNTTGMTLEEIQAMQNPALENKLNLKHRLEGSKNYDISHQRQYSNERVNEDTENEGSRTKQYIAAVCASITIIVCGAGQTWSSPAIPHLTREHSLFLVTDAQAIWIVSLYNVGDLIGALLNPLFIDRIGPRLITGISQGSSLNCLIIYLTEISDKNVRGMLVNMIQISFHIETPYFYLLKGKKTDAMKCLMKLRGINSSNKLEPEIREMELVIEEDKKNTKTFAFFELFTKSYNRKGLIIMFFMRATMMLSGYVCIVAYSEDILSQNSLPIKAGVQVMIVKMKKFYFGSYDISRQRQYSNERINEDTKNEGSRTKQYIAAICASITIIACGASQIWSSSGIPYLTSKHSLFLVTDAHAIWIVSLYNVGDLIGALLNPLIIDRIGRKYTLLLSALPGLIGWCLIIFAKNYIHLYIARLISGISQGSTLNCLIIYLTEISERNIRGRLVNIMHIALNFGIFIFTIVAAFTSYHIFNISAASLIIFFLLLFQFAPETPYYYFLHDKDDDAIKCLMKLRGITSSEKLEGEIREIKIAIEEDRKNTKTIAFLELFSKNYNRKGVIIMFCMKMTQMLSGITPVLYNAEEILSHNNLPIKAGVQVVIWQSISLPAAILTGFFIDRFSRKILFLTSGILTSIFLTIIGIFFFMIDYLHRDATSYAWLPLVSVTTYQIVYTLGIGSIPYIIQGELFPIRVKGSAVCLGRIISDTFGFVTSAGYKPLCNAFGVYTTFWFFALATFVGSLISYLISTDTARMTLEEIQAIQNPELGKKLELERGVQLTESIRRRRCA